MYIVVDVEAAGPSPETYALLAIGACTLDDPPQTFYVELQPDRPGHNAQALAVSGLSLERLAAVGAPPDVALQALADWVARVAPAPARPVVVALNAPFDWMFLNVYMHRYLGRNPLGHAALDIKAYYMGLHGVAWAETSYREITRRYPASHSLSHDALDDSLAEARVFRAMLAESRTTQGGIE
ncbi:MAG: 3'-5' exonuclease [Chloroflexota bacterium]